MAVLAFEQLALGNTEINITNPFATCHPRKPSQIEASIVTFSGVFFIKTLPMLMNLFTGKTN
jgi:hypothetical protein